MRSASNGMPCCFDIPEARRDPSLGFCDLCSERLRVKVETDAELSRLRAEVERLRGRLSKAEHLIRIAWSTSYGSGESPEIMYKKFLEECDRARKALEGGNE